MEKNISFRMAVIQVPQFAILQDKAPNLDNVFNIDTQFQFKIDANNKMIGCLASIKYRLEDTVFLIADVFCGFAIHPENWDSLIVKGKISFSKNFLRHITLHTIGTARGIIYSRTESTPFSMFILPPINVEEAIKEDVTFPLE